MKIKFDPGFFLMLSFLFIFFDTSWILYAFFAAALHELGHIAVMMLFHMDLSRVTFNASGVSISYMGKYTPYVFDIFAAAAGPMLNLIAAVISSAVYKSSGREDACIFMLLNICLAVFNLLPIKYLDGGKILYSASAMLTDPIMADKILMVFSKLFSLLIVILGIYLFYISSYNITLLTAAVWLLYVVNKPDMV